MTDEMPVMSMRTIIYDFKRILTSHIAVADRHIGSMQHGFGYAYRYWMYTELLICRPVHSRVQAV